MIWLNRKTCPATSLVTFSVRSHPARFNGFLFYSRSCSKARFSQYALLQVFVELLQDEQPDLVNSAQAMTQEEREARLEELKTKRAATDSGAWESRQR